MYGLLKLARCVALVRVGDLFTVDAVSQPPRAADTAAELRADEMLNITDLACHCPRFFARFPMNSESQTEYREKMLFQLRIIKLFFNFYLPTKFRLHIVVIHYH